MSQKNLFIAQLILIKIISTTTTTTTTAVNTEWSKCDLKFNLKLDNRPDKEDEHKQPALSPHIPARPIIVVGGYQWVHINCGECCRIRNESELLQQLDTTTTPPLPTTTTYNNNSSNINNNHTDEKEHQKNVKSIGLLLMEITSTNGHAIALSKSKAIAPSTYTNNCESNNTECVVLYLLLFDTSAQEPDEQLSVDMDRSMVKTQITNLDKIGFYLHAENLGYSRVRASLIWININVDRFNGTHASTSATTASTVSTTALTTSEALMNKVNSDAIMEILDFENNGIPPSLQQNQQIFKHIHLEINEKYVLGSAQIPIPLIYQTNESIMQNRIFLDQTGSNYWTDVIQVTVLLRPQKFYTASDWSAALIAFMLALSVGCCDDPILVKDQFQQPKALLISLCVQLLVLPLIALGLGICFSLDTDQAFGLFVVSLIPAGGLSYLLTYLANGDRQLSATLPLFNCLINLANAPLWLWLIGQYWFDRPLDMLKTFGWLLVITSGQTMGTLIRGCRPAIARAILTWITRPLLLLSGILLITLGVYINHYAFNEVTQNLIIALLALITSGFLIGWLIGLLIKQELTTTRTMSTSFSVFNGLLCMPLLRTTLSAPEGDLTAVVALWTIFLTPIPLVYNATVTILQQWIKDYMQQRRKKLDEENCLEIMLGDKQHGLGAASVVAVAAAAVAVTPAIATSNRLARTGSQTATNRQIINPIERSEYISRRTDYNSALTDNKSQLFDRHQTSNEYDNTNSTSDGMEDNEYGHSTNITQNRSRAHTVTTSYVPHRAWTKSPNWCKDLASFGEQEPMIISPKTNNPKTAMSTLPNHNLYRLDSEDIDTPNHQSTITARTTTTSFTAPYTNL